MLLSFVAGLGLGYLRRRIMQTLVFGVLVAVLLAILSSTPYKLSNSYSDVRYLLPLSYPLHAEIQAFIVVLIFPTPPHLRLTIYFINTPIIVRWYYTMPNAFLTSFAIFLSANLVTMIIAIRLGQLIHDRLRSSLRSHV